MAIEVCSNSCHVSPRISFSQDVSTSDIVPVEEQPPLRSSFDFDFCVGRSDQESLSADELFSDGKILPMEIKKKTKHLGLDIKNSHESPEVNKTSSTPVKNIKITRDETGEDLDERQIRQIQNSFCGFKRSCSLKCGNGYRRSLCFLPLLSRSNSTGSRTRAALARPSKQVVTKLQNSSSYGKPSLNKSYGNHCISKGVMFCPILNVSGIMFGLGSLFFCGKDKNKKR